MFLNLLQPDQQRLFVEAARAVAQQDGNVSDAEESLLAAIAAESSLDEMPDQRPLDEILNDLENALDERAMRNAFMLELAGVAVIDGDAHPAELTALGKIAETTGVSDAELEEFVAFAFAARDLVVRGRQLVAGGEV